MRPVGILALLSAAVFLFCWDAATGVVLPSVVTVNVKIYLGTLFLQRNDWNDYINKTFIEAQAKLDKFKYGTTFKLKKAAWAHFDDTALNSFVTLEGISESSMTQDINLHLFFAGRFGYQGNHIRNPELRGKMCSIEAKFRTLLINEYTFDGRTDQTTRRAGRILTYYVGMLLGMRSDVETGCSGGIMDPKNWDNGGRMHPWNDCNAVDLRTFFMASPMYTREWRSTDACVDHEDKHYMNLPKKLRLSVLVALEPGFNQDTAQSVFNSAQSILRKQTSNGETQLAISINIMPISWASVSTTIDATSFAAANNQAYTFTQDKPHDLFVFFTKSGLLKPAHDYVKGSICSTDKHHRIIILDQKDWKIGSSTYKMSNDALARQLVYFIASSLGIRTDNNHKDGDGNRCADGFMKYKDKSSYSGSDDDKLKKMLNYWNTKINTEWNMCNRKALRQNLRSKLCLETERRVNN